MSEQSNDRTFQSPLWPLIVVAVLAVLIVSALFLVIPLPTEEELQEADREVVTSVEPAPTLYTVVFGAAVALVIGFVTRLRKKYLEEVNDV